MDAAEIIQIVEQAKLMSDSIPGNGKRILLTAGPTCEDIDPVRFLTNRSTGRMGIEAARASLDLGLKPLLICGPVSVDIPHGIPCVPVRSAEDMYHAVSVAFEWCELLFMSAAVADYTPADFCEDKLKKNDGDLLLRLKRTKDILLSLSRSEARQGKVITGFSLDKDINLSEGRRKLEAKGLDFIAVNGAENFGSDLSTVCLLGRTGSSWQLSSDTKYVVSRDIIQIMLDAYDSE